MSPNQMRKLYHFQILMVFKTTISFMGVIQVFGVMILFMSQAKCLIQMMFSYLTQLLCIRTKWKIQKYSKLSMNTRDMWMVCSSSFARNFQINKSSLQIGSKKSLKINLIPDSNILFVSMLFKD